MMNRTVMGKELEPPDKCRSTRRLKW
jgi:hypothetical protein